MSTLEQIIANAKFAKNAVIELEPKLKNKGLLWEYFHLRPTSDGITVVSNSLRYPMRGVNVGTEGLEKLLLELDSDAVRLLAAGLLEDGERERLGEVMERLGFQTREEAAKEAAGPRVELQEHVQARFISGMIRGGAEYAGIRFLASELILPDESAEQQSRFDVVGYKDGTLYLFEIRRGRETEAYDRLSRYRAYYEAHTADFERLLTAYPRTACQALVSLHALRCVAVMRYAANSPVNWQEKSTAANADTWFFESSYSFRKLSAK